jgi:hypothetical protein
MLCNFFPSFEVESAHRVGAVVLALPLRCARSEQIVLVAAAWLNLP